MAPIPHCSVAERSRVAAGQPSGHLLHHYRGMAKNRAVQIFPTHIHFFPLDREYTLVRRLVNREFMDLCGDNSNGDRDGQFGRHCLCGFIRIRFPQVIHRRPRPVTSLSGLSESAFPIRPKAFWLHSICSSLFDTRGGSRDSLTTFRWGTRMRA
jgi:hypothetical protein